MDGLARSAVIAPWQPVGTLQRGPGRAIVARHELFEVPAHVEHAERARTAGKGARPGAQIAKHAPPGGEQQVVGVASRRVPLPAVGVRPELLALTSEVPLALLAQALSGVGADAPRLEKALPVHRQA